MRQVPGAVRKIRDKSIHRGEREKVKTKTGSVARLSVAKILQMKRTGNSAAFFRSIGKNFRGVRRRSPACRRKRTSGEWENFFEGLQRNDLRISAFTELRDGNLLLKTGLYYIFFLLLSLDLACVFFCLAYSVLCGRKMQAGRERYLPSDHGTATIHYTVLRG